MKKNILKSAALSLAAIMVLGGCGGGNSSSSETQSDPLELESNGKSLIFYSTSTNEQYAFDVDSEATIDLNSLTNFNMNGLNKGKPFLWLDDKGDTNSSNDEEKLIMFHQEYSFTEHNATWEDFYYLGHFHADTNESYSLAAHSHEEFNVTSGAKYNAMIRLNQYLQKQETIKQNLTATIPSEANGLCTFHTFVNEENETLYYAMGKNGTMYIYDQNITAPAIDSVAVASSCEINKVGMSSTEDGVLLFLESTQQIYSIDSHEDGVYHAHNSWDLSQLIGSGKSSQIMVGLKPLVNE